MTLLYFFKNVKIENKKLWYAEHNPSVIIKYEMRVFVIDSKH